MRQGSNLIGKFCGNLICGRKAIANLAVAVLLSCLPLVTCADEIDYVVTTQNQLGTVDLQTGAFTLLGSVNGIAGGETGDIAREPGGLLYGMDSSAKRQVGADRSSSLDDEPGWKHRPQHLRAGIPSGRSSVRPFVGWRFVHHRQAHRGSDAGGSRRRGQHSELL